MGLKHLLNTNLASFYEDNPLEVQFQGGGLELENTNTQIPGVANEAAFGIDVEKIPGNIRFRSIVPSVAADSSVGKWFQKIGIRKKVGALDTITWSDGLNGSKSDYPLVWNNMDSIDEPYSSPLQNTVLYKTQQVIVNSAIDGVRISKFFSPFKFLNPGEEPVPADANWLQKTSAKLNENFSSNYLVFKASQKLLALQSPKIRGVERGFNVLNVILSSMTQAVGTRFQTAYSAPLTGNIKDIDSAGGLGTFLRSSGDVRYFSVVKDDDNTTAVTFRGYVYPNSRLPSLYVRKIAGFSIIGNDVNNITPGDEDGTTLLRYYGGSDAPLGALGFTTINRWENTIEKTVADGRKVFAGFSDNNGGKGVYENRPSSEQVPPISVNPENGILITGSNSSFISSISRYKKFNKENQPGGENNGYGMSGGETITYLSLPRDTEGRVDFLKATKKNLDFINAQNSFAKNDAYDNANLIKFSIEIMSNEVEGNSIAPSQHLYFRAFIDQFQDSYKPKWDGYRYVGRAEEFYRYSAFGRDINLGFTIAAFSRKEIIPLYNKINKLVGITAPDYSGAGLMRGNIIKLTVGDYLTSVPGILTGLSLTPIFEAGWDINRNNNGEIIERGAVGYTGQLPIAIKVDGFNFTPIHNFTPTKNSPFINFGTTSGIATANGDNSILNVEETIATTTTEDLPDFFSENEDNSNRVMPKQTVEQQKLFQQQYEDNQLERRRVEIEQTEGPIINLSDLGIQSKGVPGPGRVTLDRQLGSIGDSPPPSTSNFLGGGGLPNYNP
jgi:hypothetical protein